MMPIFSESQRFSQVWLWIILLGTSFIPVIGLYQQIVVGVPFGNNPMSNLGLVLMLLFEAALLTFFWSIRLVTEMDHQEIRFAYRPFMCRSIPWNEVQKAAVVNYGFVGGWGIRFSHQFGKVYNVSGKMGLALELTNGSKICIGTQQPDAMQAALKQIQR